VFTVILKIPVITEVVAVIAEGEGRCGDEYELRKPLYSPVIGAAIYAARLAGEHLDAETLRHLEASM
jgi:hypothetical protein